MTHGVSTPDDLLAAAEGTTRDLSIEDRIARLEALVGLAVTTSNTPMDPDAVPGEMMVSERDRRHARGDGGAVAAYAYPLPKPLGHLRVRFTETHMVILWRSPSGERHETRFPL